MIEHQRASVFRRHGRLVAVYWLWYLSASVLLGLTVVYYGSASLPRHEWTYATAATGLEDIVVRRIWIHGDYMGALDPRVLEAAREVQTALQRGSKLSPLSYWDLSDVDPLQAIKTRVPDAVSELEFTRKLTAADGLVFTQTTISKRSDRPDRSESTISESDRSHRSHRSHGSDGDTDSEEWTQLQSLASRSEWIFSSSGVSQLVEYHLERMSRREATALGSLYAAIVIVFLIRIRATSFRCHIGLIVGMAADLMVANVAGFALCRLLQIEFSLPRWLYPVAVIVNGSENMLRLVHAALDQPPQTEETRRMAVAVSRAGPVSIWSTTQTLLALYALSKVVSSNVQSLCVFAGLALAFDLCFHLVFFAAAMSVHLRRMELQDSLHRRKARWLNALLHGLPRSNRLLGTGFSICFVLALNLLLSPRYGSTPSIYQAQRKDWLQLQNHLARVLPLVKPGAQSLIARVYQPEMIVLNGSDRATRSSFDILLSLSLISVSISLVALLDQGYRARNDVVPGLTDVLHVRKIPVEHSLDIYRLVSSPQGHAVSVGLDRTISIISYSDQSFSVKTIPAELWPVFQVAIEGERIAVSSRSQIGIWNQSWTRFEAEPCLMAFVDGELIVAISDAVLFGQKKIRMPPIQSAIVAHSATGVYVVCQCDDGIQIVSASSTRRIDGHAPTLYYIQALNILCLIRNDCVELIDFDTLQKICKIAINTKSTSSVRFLFPPVKECRHCRSPAVCKLSIVFASNNLTLESYTATEGEHPSLCLNPVPLAACEPLARCVRDVKTVRDPGQWEATSRTVIGIRHSRAPEPEPKPRFEVWAISPVTDLVVMPLAQDKEDLYAAAPGPVAPLGGRSVAIALGNTLHVVTAGTDRIEQDRDRIWRGKGARSNEFKRRVTDKRAKQQ